MSNFYITTSIPYVNSEPHIGFGMELVMADVLARYMRQYKSPVIFCTGTDEHGGKIAEKAAEAKMTPKAMPIKSARLSVICYHYSTLVMTGLSAPPTPPTSNGPS